MITLTDEEKREMDRIATRMKFAKEAYKYLDNPELVVLCLILKQLKDAIDEANFQIDDLP